MACSSKKSALKKMNGPFVGVISCRVTGTMVLQCINYVDVELFICVLRLFAMIKYLCVFLSCLGFA